MARTEITVNDMGVLQLAGLIITGNTDTGQADGYYFQNTGDVMALVTKSTTSGSVTFQTGGTVSGGDAIAERPYVCNTTDVAKLCGPFPLYCDQKGTSNVYVDFELGEETEFEILLFKVTKQR